MAMRIPNDTEQASDQTKCDECGNWQRRSMFTDLVAHSICQICFDAQLRDLQTINLDDYADSDPQHRLVSGPDYDHDSDH